jgi:hypothetical protein
MKIIKRVVKEVEEVQDYLCNRCGKTCHYRDPDEPFAGLLEVEYVAGYFSIFGDGDIYRFSLCELCLKELFASFKLAAYQGNVQFPELYLEEDLLT